jgi:hypothetical protein
VSALVIYADNQVEGLWFKSLSPLLATARTEIIKARGENPQVIERLIAYDRPDIVLCRGHHAILVLEKTREVPTGHNVGQRVARLVRSVEEGVPTIKFFPFDAMKHGEYAGRCNLNIRLLLAFDRMSAIHRTPILAVNWPCDRFSELVDDGQENNQISRLIDRYLDSGAAHDCKAFLDHREWMRTEYSRRLKSRPSYGAPPPSVTLEDTRTFLDQHNCSRDSRRHLETHSESLVYRIEMTKEKCRREDPYTGTQFIYDYIWCRSGARPEQKHRNLILHFPKLNQRTWEERNPNDPSRKSCNWYLTANALVFNDAVSVIR